MKINSHILKNIIILFSTLFYFNSIFSNTNFNAVKINFVENCPQFFRDDNIPQFDQAANKKIKVVIIIAIRKFSHVKNAYYMFIVPNFSSPQLQGYMVRGRAVGFIKTGSSVNDVAHELGHGAFKLEHTFDGIAKGTSNNLMDYSNQTHLTKSQWLNIQNPSSELTWWDEEEDGSLKNTVLDDYDLVKVLLFRIKDSYQNNTKVNIPGSSHNGPRLIVDDITIAGHKYQSIAITRRVGNWLKVNAVNKVENQLASFALKNYSYKGIAFDNNITIYASNDVDYNSLKNYLLTNQQQGDYKPAFKKFNYNIVLSEINARKSNPIIIRQSNTPLCGLACIAYCMATDDQTGYENVIKDLYFFGCAEYGTNKFKISPNNLMLSQVYEMDPNSGNYPSGVVSGKMAQADYILLTSLKSSENDLLPYQGVSGGAGAQGMSGMTGPSSMKKLCQEMLVKTTVVENMDLTNNVLTTKYDFNTLVGLNNYRNAGYKVFMLINPDMIDNPSDYSIIPRHWVLFLGNLVKNNVTNKYSFTVFSWGLNTTGEIINVTEYEFKDHMYGYIIAK